MNRRQRLRRARLKRALVVGPVALVIGLATLGLFLPRHHAESARRELPASPETIWQLLMDLDGMSAWRHDLAALERLPGSPGLVQWREVGPDGGSAAMERTEAVPPVRLVIQPAGPPNGELRWVYHLQATRFGTQLEVREERRIDNPLVRGLVSVFGVDRTRIDGVVSDLARRLASRRPHVAVR